MDTEWKRASEIQRLGHTLVKGQHLIKCGLGSNELKMMQEIDDLCDRQTDERYKRGCRAIMRLDGHGNGYPCPNNVSWIKMLYANLGSLGSLLRRQVDINNPIFPIEVRELIRDDLRSALDFLGTTGWVHGDIKPDNIVLQQDMETGAVSGILVDYGAAEPNGVSTHIRGTVEYLPGYMKNQGLFTQFQFVQHPQQYIASSGTTPTLMEHGLDRYGWVLTMYELSMGRLLAHHIDETAHLTWVNWERSTSCPEHAHKFLQSESLYAYAQLDYHEDKIPRHILPGNEDHIRYAATKGHLRILQDCRVRGAWANFRGILYLASTHGHLNIVHWALHQVATVPEQDIRIAILYATFGKIDEPSRFEQLEDVIVFLQSMVGSEVPHDCQHCGLSMTEAFNRQNTIARKRKLQPVPKR